MLMGVESFDYFYRQGVLERIFNKAMQFKIMLPPAHLFHLVMPNECLLREHWRIEMTAIIVLEWKYLQGRNFF